MMGGTPGYKYHLRGLEKAFRLSLLLPGADMARAWGDFPWCHCLLLLCLAVKFSHMGVMWRGYAATYTSL
jgi:hypothetical protein